MAKNIKSLQLLRNGQLFNSYADAVEGITSGSTDDGVIKLARYTDANTDPYSGGTNGAVKTIFGIYHAINGVSGYTIYESYKEVIKAIKDKIDAIAGEGSGSIADQIRTAIEALDYTGYEAADSKVVTAVSESDGVVSVSGTNLTSVKLTGYQEGTDADVAATDTLGQALGKLQAQINAMDKNADAVDGQVVTTVAEADGKVTETKANVKDLQLGGYSKDANATGDIASTDTINTALSKLENNIDALSDSTDAKIDALDATATTTTSQVFGQITQTDGLVAATQKLATSLVMEGLAATADTKIAAADTLGQALGKLQGQIDSMDLSAVGSEGSVITSVSEEDGKVSAAATPVKDIKLTGYVKDTTKTGAIAATDDIEDALSKLENKAAAITITNTDGTINVTTGVSGTDINVNVKSGEKVIKKDGNGGLYTDLDLVKIESGLPTTVKERYEFRDSDGNKIGESIDIAKDSHIVSITYNETTQKLIYKYLDASGAEQTAEVDMAHLILETEVENGIQSVNGKLSIKLDTTGDDTGDGKFLTVGADGLKLDGVTDAINAAINALDVTGDTAVDGQYVAAIEETDGKVAVKTRANVSDAVLNGYTKGTDATAIAATDSLKAALSKLENQVDKAKAAATTKVAEGTDAGNNMTIASATSDSDGSVTYTVNLTDVAKASAVGLANDGSHVTTSGKYTSAATTIAGEIAALDSALDTVSGKVDNAQAEIDRMESAIGLNNDGTYAPNTSNTYTSAATTVNDAIDKLDAAAKSLAEGKLSGVTVNGKSLTVANNVAAQTVQGKTSEATTTGNEAIVVETDDNGNLTLGIAILDAGFYDQE